jgi:hypothetical protein
MKEREFQSWILDVAAQFGWRVWHVPAPMRPVGGNRFVPEPRAAGLPDLILLHDSPPRLIFAEVKDADGTTSAKQDEFLRLARGVAGVYGIPATIRPVAVYVWRPGNEALIESVLRGERLAA